MVIVRVRYAYAHGFLITQIYPYLLHFLRSRLLSVISLSGDCNSAGLVYNIQYRCFTHAN